MYRIIGADQREYGPVSGEEVRSWILQSRLNGRSLARLESSVGWKPLWDFPEFAGTLAQVGPQAMSPRSVATGGENGLAMTSLILGCLSLVCCQPLAFISLILGIVALTQINADKTRGGRGLAIAGIAVSIAAIALLGLLAAFGAFKEILEKLLR